MRQWSEPVDLPFLLSQTKYIGPVAVDEADVYSDINDMVAQCVAGGQPKFELHSTHLLDEADVDSDIYDMVAQCVAGGQPKFDLIRTHTRL